MSILPTLVRPKRIALVVLLALFAGCDSCRDLAQPDDEAAFEPTTRQLLSTGSPTKDEDPSVLRASDGSMYVAWFSDRGGNPDIYLTRTNNGREWHAPVRVTTDAGGDFYPNLLQDANGMFHLVWFRWINLQQGNIWYNSSADGITWDTRREVKVTQALNVDDWVPSITQTADGTLLVFFASQRRSPSSMPTFDLYVSAKRASGTTWDPVVGVAGVNSPTEHDQIPVAARTGDRITLVWVRHDLSRLYPWEGNPPPKSDLFYATSADGTTWTTPRRITNETGTVVNVFPALYQNFAGDWSLNWLSTRSGSPSVFELPLSNADRYPEGIAVNNLLGAGYSHHIAASPTRGVYLGVWVEGPDGAQDIYYRFFEK
ncbi:MAG: sialidase family protein [Longimicrobiales bacterium]